MMKLVSAIITTHNRLELLKKAIKSVQAQTYSDIEILVVNDNSTDGTTAYLNSLHEIRHIYISAEETRGGNYARNLGIRNAAGIYIAFLDDDDEWLPDKIEKQIALLEKYPEVGLVFCGHIEELNFTIKRNVTVDDNSPTDMSKICFEKIFCTTSMILARKQNILEIGCFDENLKYWQEYDFCIRMAQKTFIAAVKEPEIILRVIEGDKNRLSNKYDGWIAAVNYIEKKYRNIIDTLPDDIKTNRELMILREKAFRCEKVGKNKEKRRILFQIWKITKNPKHFVKFLFNIAKFYS